MAVAESDEQPKPALVQREHLRGAATQRRAKRRQPRLVLLMKIGLPLVALATMGYLGYWWFVHNRESVITVETLQNAVPGQPTVTLNDFKYSSVDDKNRPYTITAPSASQPQGDQKDTITLVKPKADITLANNGWMAVTAQNGLYHRDADLVDLSGDVTLSHDNGMSFHSASAQVDLKAKIAAGSDPVEGQNKDWAITAQGFRVLNDGDLIIFRGRSHLKLYGKGKDGNG
jgi:lipopolysaccharide export system protein LptC